MQITIQKKYLVLVETSENIFRLFLVIVNFVFNIVLEIKEEISNTVSKTVNKIKTFFESFARKVLGVTRLQSHLLSANTKSRYIKNDFVIYSNLLAPPNLILK